MGVWFPHMLSGLFKVAYFMHFRVYYGLPKGFPVEQLLTRTRTGKKKNLYFSSRLVKELTIRNEHVLKVSTGVPHGTFWILCS